MQPDTNHQDAGDTPAGDRRTELIRIAYRQIVDNGFEGLRVRDVSAKAGINNATLHHYFPTKEALIGGVVQHLIRQFQTSRLPRPDRIGTPATALDALREEFDDVRARLHETPDVFVVLMELINRSRRDPAIAEILGYMDTAWRTHFASIIERGARDGSFRADLDPVDVAGLIMVQVKAVAYQVVPSRDAPSIDALVSQLRAQIEHWLKPAGA
jgi:AcrR family transcriptional regulator